MRNVVLLTFDSLRADHCGHHGYERDTTPTIDDVAADGVSYENAMGPASRTNPAMAGSFTGEPLVVRDAVSNPEHSRYHLARHGTIAESMSEQGYATGAFCPNAYASRFYGFDRGFDHYEDFMFDNDLYQRVFQRHLGDSSVWTALRNARNFARRQEAFKTWDRYVDDVEDWVDAQSEPFFLWAFSLDTHFPYITPRAHREWSGLVDTYYYNWQCNRLIDAFDVDVDGRTIRKIIDLYDDSIRYADRFVAELRDRLAEYDPVFVIHADHGEAFAEHGTYGHFYPSLYEENVHVPLVVGGSGVPSRTVERPASLLDLPDVVDAAAHQEEGFPDGHDWVTGTTYDGRRDRNLFAVRTADKKFMRVVEASGTDDECYDLAADPNERADQYAADPAYREPLERLTDRRERHERELLAIRDAARRQRDESGTPRRRTTEVSP